jgi:hypothetical protein
VRVSAVIAGVDLRRAARWLTLLQTPRGSQCGPSSWASRSACPIGTSPNLTPRGRADQWRRYRRPSGYRATDKTGSQFRTSVDPVGRSGYRRVANRRDVAGRNLDFVGHVGGRPSNSSRVTAGRFARHSLAFGTSDRHCRWQQVSWRRLPLEAKAMIARSGRSFTRGTVGIGKLR